MQTIRARLAVWYALALGATLLLFGAILYVLQRSEAFAELDRRVQLEADLIATVLREARRARETIVVTNPVTGRPTLAPEVAALFQGVPGFVVILLEGGDVVYVSAGARTVSVPAFSQLFEVVGDTSAPGAFGFVNLNPPFGETRYFVRPVADAGPSVAGIVVGIPAAGAGLGPRRLLAAMLGIAPFVIAASWFIGYFLVGRTLRPVDQIVDEVQAISDGRSLHRRLARFRQTHDEVGRLIATLNQMLGRLERSFGSLRRFTADASHELKTPLTVLRAGIERSLTHPGTPPDVLETLEETLAEVNRMTEMVDSLLTLARADEGRAPLHLDDLDLREILSELEETASLLGEQGGVAVDVTVPSGAIPLRADRSRVRQLLMNLLTNAIKYTPTGGRVWVGSSLENGRVVITVRDTGIGIAPGDLPHVFDRFWRADPARSRTGERSGAGLGLAISKWAAEAHGGAIEVESRPGRGTTFTVWLPLRGES